MRVAYVCADPGVPVFGHKGCSVHLRQIVRALLRRGAEVDLFATRLDGQAHDDFAGVRIHRLPSFNDAPRSERERLALEGNAPVCEILEREGPFDLVYERYSLWSFAGMEYARASGVAGLLEVNAPLVEEAAEHRGLIDRPAAQEVAARVFAAATALIAVSLEVRDYLLRYPVTRARAHVISNGVNCEEIRPDVKASRPADPGTFTVGFVGSLKPWHGLDVLAEAFATLAKEDAGVRLLVVGKGPQREKMEADLSARLPNWENVVQFTGAVPAEEIPGLLASMDVAVAPYPEMPNFYFSPLKVYEYMAAGLPAVASNLGELSRLIRDNENGVLCRPGDVAALAAELRRLRGAPDVCRRLSLSARAHVLEHHTWDSVAQRILRLAGVDLLVASSCMRGE